jgi:hypothetical protein
MKTFTYYIFIVITLVCFVNKISAQNSNSNLDQVLLMSQFTGTWKCEVAKDTLYIWEIKSFGKGFEGLITRSAKGVTYNETKQIWGFNSDYKKIFCYFLSANGILKLYRGTFISEKKLYMEMFDITGDKILASNELILISPDEFTHTPKKEGYGKRTITFHRIKK